MCAIELGVYLCLIKCGTVTSIVSTFFIMCICFSDDDFSESTGYHCALPLEVHGAGYAQLQMISNTKAGKLVSVVKQTDCFLWDCRQSVSVFLFFHGFCIINTLDELSRGTYHVKVLCKFG